MCSSSNPSGARAAVYRRRLVSRSLTTNSTWSTTMRRTPTGLALLALKAAEEASPTSLGVGSVVQVADALCDDFADSLLLAGVEPPAMLLACVQLDGVGAIVKGNHPLVADRTLKFTGNLGVHDCRAALLFSG